jgi:hypothetical protein
MRERPILFSAPMVRAILEGRKSQTRRIVKPQPVQPAADCHPKNVAKHPAPYLDAYCSQRKTPENPRGMSDQWCWWQVDDRQCLPMFRCPYGQPGGRLWVRETWARNTNQVSDTHMDTSVVYRADGEKRAQNNGTDLPWRPSIHMPRWASRILLEITGVRVERLQKISEADAQAEGIEWNPNLDPLGPCKWRHYGQPNTGIYPASSSFETLWKSINGAGSWDANPWVWVVEFKRVTA